MIVIAGETFINEKEASSHYGLSIKWFRNNRYSDNKIPYHKLNNHVFYNPKEIDDWFKINFKRRGEKNA
jgi:uncharacterized protein (UPF0248 family)